MYCEDPQIFSWIGEGAEGKEGEVSLFEIFSRVESSPGLDLHQLLPSRVDLTLLALALCTNRPLLIG